jgi:hypothetical protein
VTIDHSEVEKMVDREIILNVSNLVAELYQTDAAKEYEEELNELLIGKLDYEQACLYEGWKQAPDKSFFTLNTGETAYLRIIDKDERGEVGVTVYQQDFPEQGTNGKVVWEFSGTCEEADELEIGDITDKDNLLSYLVELEVITEGDELYSVDTIDEAFEVATADSWEELADDENIEPDELEAYEHWVVTNWLASGLKDLGEVVRKIYGFNVWARCETGQAISADRVIQEVYTTWQKRISAYSI